MIAVQERPPATVPQDAPQTLHTWRCWKCGRVIARLFLIPGCAVEIKCKCLALNIAAIDAPGRGEKMV